MEVHYLTILPKLFILLETCLQMSVIDETLNIQTDNSHTCIKAGLWPTTCSNQPEKPAWETTSSGSQPSLWKSDFQEVTPLFLVTSPTSLTVTADNYFWQIHQNYSTGDREVIATNGAGITEYSYGKKWNHLISSTKNEFAIDHGQNPNLKVKTRKLLGEKNRRISLWPGSWQIS